MVSPAHQEGNISFLSVGTKNLLTDAMDQFLRTIGNIKTHYASNLTSALRTISEHAVHILVSEIDLGEASAFRLIQSIGGGGNSTTFDDMYFVLAVDDRSDAVMALASEMEAHSLLVKPFAAQDLKVLIEKYKLWRATPKEPWQGMIREANFSARDKRFREAEENYLNALKAAPNNPIPVFKAGLYYLRKPDHNMAERLLKKSIEMNPEYVQAISALGSLYLARGDLDKAEEWLNRAQKVSPLNPDRLIEVTHLYMHRCVETCKNALRLDSSSAVARFALGKMMALQKDYIGAVRELERTLPALRDENKVEAQTFIALSKKLGKLK